MVIRTTPHLSKPLLLVLAVLITILLLRRIVRHSSSPSSKCSRKNGDIYDEICSHLQEYNSSRPTNFTIVSFMAEKYYENFTSVMGKFIIKRLGNKRGGFFIECGAYDGQWLSNTLYLEREYGWSGLLVEADPAATFILKGRNRNAWVADVCLSIKPEPMRVVMSGAVNGDSYGFIPNDALGRHKVKQSYYARKFEVQCYPLHMLLEAIGRNYVDYMGLDVEGSELDILKTIPWNNVTIKLISTEYLLANQKPVREYLKSVGYQHISTIVKSTDWIHDDVFELISDSDDN